MRSPTAPASVAVSVRLWRRRRRLPRTFVSFSVAPLAVNVCFLQPGQLTATTVPGPTPLTVIRPSVTPRSETLQVPVTLNDRRTVFGGGVVVPGGALVGAAP